MGELSIGDKVKLALTEERGIIIGKAEFSESPDSFYVRYKAGDGRQLQDWFCKEALTKE